MKLEELPRKPDGSLDTQRPVGNAFDDVLDELHSRQGDAGAGMSTVDREELERGERYYLTRVRTEVNERLQSQGLVCFRAEVARDGHEGYLVVMRDGQGRRYDVHVSFDEAIGIGERFGEHMGRELIDLVCKRALAAREHYFARMM